MYGRKRSPLKEPNKLALFEKLVMPHFDAAYRLARWLVKDQSRADDIVQEAYLRAFSSFESLRSGDSKPWLLSIVRNTCYTLLRKEHVMNRGVDLSEATFEAPPESCSPELLRIQSSNREVLQRALAKLPDEFREVLVLREFGDLSYKQISESVGLPIGTVMSRLSRARQRLQSILLEKREAGVL